MRVVSLESDHRDLRISGIKKKSKKSNLSLILSINMCLYIQTLYENYKYFEILITLNKVIYTRSDKNTNV